MTPKQLQTAIDSTVSAIERIGQLEGDMWRVLTTHLYVLLDQQAIETNEEHYRKLTQWLE